MEPLELLENGTARFFGISHERILELEKELEAIRFDSKGSMEHQSRLERDIKIQCKRQRA